MSPPLTGGRGIIFAVVCPAVRESHHESVVRPRLTRILRDAISYFVEGFQQNLPRILITRVEITEKVSKISDRRSRSYVYNV